MSTVEEYDPESGNPAEQITITILYDNTVCKEGTKSHWGFSCLIEGTEKTILFDTGWEGQILIENIDSLRVDLDSLELIVISHNHPDHTGGLDSVLGRKSDVPVYFGASYPASFGQNISNKGATPVRVDEPIKICENVFSSGELHGAVNEQSLILDTEKGLVVIVGCSHPGIINILKKVKELHNKNIYMVLGGFHLLNTADSGVNQIIEEFKELGVEKCGATHCTGERQIALFKEAYGDNFVPMGVGRVIRLSGTTTDIKESDKRELQIPNGFKLNQNYPNPFNPTTTIKYEIPATMDVGTGVDLNITNSNGNSTGHHPSTPQIHVKLCVYDILGREITTLVNEYQNPGNYEVTFDGSKLATGTYFYSLQADNPSTSSEQGFVQTKKMVLLR